jgi:hypothetical protein
MPNSDPAAAGGLPISNTPRTSRRALLTGIPASAAGIASLSTAALAAAVPCESRIAQLIREHEEIDHAERAKEDADPNYPDTPEWDSASGRMAELRLELMFERPKTFGDLKRMAVFTFFPCKGEVHGQIDDYLKRSHYGYESLTYVFLRDFVEAYGRGLDEPLHAEGDANG